MCVFVHVHFTYISLSFFLVLFSTAKSPFLNSSMGYIVCLVGCTVTLQKFPIFKKYGKMYFLLI